jgi:hypothetical protein
MPLKVQFTPKTIGALVALALVVVLWTRASNPSDGSDGTVQLDKEVKVNLTPNTTASYNPEPLNFDHESHFRQALNEAKFIFKAPSDGTYSATLKNANVQDAHDINLYGYEEGMVPGTFPNFALNNYVNTVGNFLISANIIGESINEYGTFPLRKDEKVVFVAFPFWVKSKPKNVSLLVKKI